MQRDHWNRFLLVAAFDDLECLAAAGMGQGVQQTISTMAVEGTSKGGRDAVESLLAEGTCVFYLGEGGVL